MSLQSVFSSFYSHKTSQAQHYEVGTRAEPRNDAAGDEVELGGQKNQSLTYGAATGAQKTELPGAETRTDAANNILSFITARLKMDVAEGATEDELLSRLEAGLSGFLKGYQQAYDQLSGMGFLNGDVETAIEQTYSDVLNGVDALAEELGIASPVTDGQREAQAARRSGFNEADASGKTPAEPAVNNDQMSGVETTRSGLASLLGIEPNPMESLNAEANQLRTLIEASTFDYRATEARSFQFELKTRDGDTVTIKAAYASQSVLEGESVKYGDSSASEVSGNFRAAAGFYLDVQGDLDEDELLAIEDLLTQVREVSDMFFSGDIESAFDHAVEMGFNSDEIAEFSLKLRYQQSVRYEEGYPANASSTALPADQFEKYKALSDGDDKLMIITRFIQALEDMRLKAEEFGLSGFNPVNGVEGIKEGRVENSGREAATTNANDASSNRPVDIVQGLLKGLEKLTQI